MRASTVGPWLWLALATGVGLAAGAAAALRSPLALVRHSSDAPWIRRPEPASLRTSAAPRAALPAVTFERRFIVSGRPARFDLEVEALRGFELELNGRLLAARGPESGAWRRAVQVDAAAALRAGENLLVVRVRNPSGPSLLRLRAAGSGVAFAADGSFTARAGAGPPLPAVLADDRVRAAAALPVPRLVRGLAQARERLLGCLALGLFAAAALRLPAAAPLRARPGLAWLPVLAVFAGVLAPRALRLPEHMGFDGPDHLAYVRWILERGALPLATDGGQMYHPPLYYALQAGCLALLEGPLPARVVLRLVPLACGLAQVWLADGLARALRPGDGLARAAAILAAGTLPLNLYMSAYLSNETLHGALAGGALLATVRLLLGSGASTAASLGLGALLGLAVLAKSSSLLLVPLCATFLLVGARAAGLRAGPAAGRALALVGAAAVVSGWFFARNAWRLGRPLVGNWDVPGSPLAWWQSPGFHTPAYYLRFGSVLERPFFASFDSFWDGLYSTFWGDGLLGGVAGWVHRHPLWDYDLMAAGYALALPATGLLGLGLAAWTAGAGRGGDARQRLARGFLLAAGAATLLAVLALTLVLPAYSMAKASYLLSLVAPAAAALAEGFVRLSRGPARRGGPALELAVAGLGLGVLASFAASFAG
jgi:hypothetical protein